MPEAKDGSKPKKRGMTGSASPGATEVRQNAFCTAFALSGSYTRSCKALGIGASTFFDWKVKDLYGFRAKLEKATEEFADNLHYLALDTVKNQKPSDNPALKIFMLKAWHPRYKAVDTSVTDDVGKEVMAELKKALRSEKPVLKLPSEEPRDDSNQVIEQANQILASKTNDSSPNAGKTE